MNMLTRITTGWNLQRAVFFAFGMYALVYALMESQWLAALFGGYFAAMGLFAFGCGAGNCGIPTSNSTKATDQEVEYEEIN